MADHTRGVW